MNSVTYHGTNVLRRQGSQVRSDERSEDKAKLILSGAPFPFAQELASTWDRYQKDTGRRWAERSDVGDAIDFLGWYTNLSQEVAGISK